VYLSGRKQYRNNKLTTMTELKYDWNLIIKSYKTKKEQLKIEEVISIKENIAKKTTNYNQL
jgi:hypothetical protein